MYKNIFPFSCKSSFRSKRTVGNLFFCYSTAQNRLPEQYWRTFPAVLLLVSIFTSSRNSLFRLLYCSLPASRAVLANFWQKKAFKPAHLMVLNAFVIFLKLRNGQRPPNPHRGSVSALPHNGQRPPNPHRGCSSRNPAMRFVVTSAVVGISGGRPSAPEPAPRTRTFFLELP